MEKPPGSNRLRASCSMAGMSLRVVRSPDAPNTTITAGGAMRSASSPASSGLSWGDAMCALSRDPGASATGELGRLGLEGGDQLVEGLGEGGPALLLEHATDVVEVDADLTELRQHLAGAVGIGVDRAGDGAV